MANSVMLSPGVDLVTDDVAVVMQDRPVVGMSAWLSDALVSATLEGRSLQLVTPPATRLTWPVRSTLFRAPASRWVVTTADGDAFDGLNGVRLKWNGKMFLARTPVVEGQENSDIHPDFVVKETPFGNLQITVRVRHKPVVSTLVGRVAEHLFTSTTGAGPAGWATSEPVTQLWDTTALTDYCRSRAPQPTWLVVAGQQGPEVRPAVGTVEVRRVDSGLDETVTLAVAQPGMDFPSLTRIGDAIDDVADNFELISATVMGGYGAADGTAQPRYAGIVSPIGIAVGNEVVRMASLGELLAVEGVAAQAIGPAHQPAVWYPLGDGRRPEDWNKYATVIKKLAPLQAGAPDPRTGASS